MERMTTGKFRHVPVVEQDQVVGIISIGILFVVARSLRQCAPFHAKRELGPAREVKIYYDAGRARGTMSVIDGATEQRDGCKEPTGLFFLHQRRSAIDLPAL